MVDDLVVCMRFWSSWTRALIALAVTLCLFVFYDGYVQPLRDILGDQTYLDLRMGGYGYQEALAFFNFIDEAGRGLYFQTTLLDSTWPLGLAFTCVLFAPLAFQRDWLVLVAVICPVLFGCFDIIENAGILLMLSVYPDITPTLVSFASVATFIKQTALPGAFLGFLLLPVIALVRKYMWKFQ